MVDVARGPRDREALGHSVAGDAFSCLRARFLRGVCGAPHRMRRLSIGTRRPGRNTRHQVRPRKAATADRDWIGTGYPGWSTWHGGLVIGKYWATPWPRTIFSVSLPVFLGVYVAHPRPRAAVVNQDSVSGSGHSASGALLRSRPIPVAARPQKHADEASLDPQLRHLDHAWASTVHAFQGRTVDNVIAAIEARHPHLTTQKSFYVEISRARERAELVTDNAAELRAQLQAVPGERIAALEGIGEMPREVPGRALDSDRASGRTPDHAQSPDRTHGRDRAASGPAEREGPASGRGRPAEMDLGL